MKLEIKNKICILEHSKPKPVTKPVTKPDNKPIIMVSLQRRLNLNNKN